VQAFLKRRIEGEWPYLWLDATYLKVREGGRVVSIAAIIATGVNHDGRREILGLGLGPSEAATFWLGFLRGLQQRGLTGVKLDISDSHEGLKAAISQIFTASWQRCRVHFMRNALAHVPKGQHSMVAAAIRTIFAHDTAQAAAEAWRHIADQLRPRFEATDHRESIMQWRRMLAIAIGLAAICPNVSTAADISVAVAANFSDAAKEIAALFRAKRATTLFSVSALPGSSTPRSPKMLHLRSSCRQIRSGQKKRSKTDSAWREAALPIRQVSSSSGAEIRTW
jgi:hypothetical protein